MAINVGSVELVRHQFVTGPQFVIVAVPQSKTTTVNVPVSITPSVTGPTSYRWSVSPSTNASLDYIYGSNTVVTFSATGSYALYGYGINSCGESASATVMYIITVSSASTYSLSAYPNPASGTLNVQIEEPETASSTASGASGTGARAQQPVYTISLYSITGTLALRTTASDAGTVQLNVGNLPGGIYTLHVHDGTDSPPVTQQIVIAH